MEASRDRHVVRIKVNPILNSVETVNVVEHFRGANSLKGRSHRKYIAFKN